MDNKSKAFAVKLASGNAGKLYKSVLMNKILNKYPQLSVAGLDEPFYTNSGNSIKSVEYAGANTHLTFGASKTHDVNWSNNKYSEYNGVIRSYDIIKDWAKISAKLDDFAESKKANNMYENTYYKHSTGDIIYVGGQKVEVYDAFIKIGLHIIPRYINRSNFYTLTPVQISVIRTISIEIF